MALVRCPICGTIFDANESRAMPFCSPRCRQIDLGHWLGESYGLPYESEQDSPDEPASNN